MSREFASRSSDRTRELGPRPDSFTVSATFGSERLRPDQMVETVSLAMLDAWTATLGPTSVLLWLRLATIALAAQTGGSAVVDVEEMRSALGVQTHVFWRSMDRLQYSGKVRWCSGDVLGVDVVTNPPRARSAAPACRA